MSKLLWKSLLLSTALVVGANVTSVFAQTSNTEILDQINQYNQEGVTDQGQIRSITELRDVSPTDWAYQALRNLVEEYDCIEGYPNRTFRGDRALTRYEFAAGLNACLEKIGSLDGDYVTQEEFDQLKRLVDQFQPELEALGARVDSLEARVDVLEDNQFSTTTKLKGEAIFALTDVFGGDVNFGAGTVASLGDDNHTIFGDRVRLTLESSFSGDDLLVTRLAAGNLSPFSTVFGTHPETTQTFNLGNNGNDIVIDWAAYYLPVGESELYIAATGGIHSDYVHQTNNPYFEDYDGGNGALSTFASENPIYRVGGGAGVGATVPLGDTANIRLGYLADEASNPADGNGLFNGNYAMLGQVDFELGDNFGVGLTYVNAYNDSASAIFDAGAGINPATGLSNGIVGTTGANLAGTPSGTVSNSYGTSLAWMPSDKISISGFFNYTDAILLKTGGAEIWSYGMGVAFPDLGKEGNVLGIFGGAQPYVGLPIAGSNVPYHIEAFYKYKVNDNISITPGLIWLTNPEGDTVGDTVDDAIIGTLRTTFTF